MRDCPPHHKPEHPAHWSNIDYIERDGAGEDGREADLYTDEKSDLDKAVLIERSERYGIIERSKDFSLEPWREVMNRNMGKKISGMVRGRQISWTLTRGRGIS
ncbi:MAG: DUF3363 domain-containing protein [bacterium]